jgi:excisionase family DNA binding protein
MNTYALSMSPATAPPLLVSEREAGRLLGVTARTVYELRKSGELAAVRIGARVLYSRNDLTAFIASRRQIAGANQ